MFINTINSPKNDKSPHRRMSGNVGIRYQVNVRYLQAAEGSK